MRVNLFRRGRVWHGQWSIIGGACVVCGDGARRVHRHSTECTDKEAAKAVAARWERLAADPSYRAAKTTVEAAARRFLSEIAATGCAEATAEMYDCKARHVVRVLGASLPVAQVDATAVDRFIATRRAEGASSSTIYKELCALRGILRSAARRGEYPREPRSVMPLRFRVGYTPRKRFLTLAELARVCACLPPSRAAFVRFVVATGARLGEVVRAERSDVAERVVWLRSTKLRPGAPSRTREVPITTLTRPLMDLALEEADGDGALLFSAWPCVHRDLRMACERSGVGVVIPNDLRRTFASLHLQAGASEEHVSRAMGHASTAMLRKVYGVVPGEKLGALMEPPKERLVMVDRVKCPACDGGFVTSGNELTSSREPCGRCGASGYVGVWDTETVTAVEGAREMAGEGQKVPGGDLGGSAPRSGGPCRSRIYSQRIKSPIPESEKPARSALTAQEACIIRRGGYLDGVRAAASEVAGYQYDGYDCTVTDPETGEDVFANETDRAVADGIEKTIGACLARLRDLSGIVEKHQRKAGAEEPFPEPAGVLDAIAATARIGRLGERSGDREVVIGTLRGMAERLGMTFAPGRVRHVIEHAGSGDAPDVACPECAKKDAKEGGSDG